jgi:hypothetical protein
MGRQLPIVATPTDERELLTFIRTLSPIRVYVSFAETIDALWIDDWEHRYIEGCGFTVWLQTFPWAPEYKQTCGPRCPADHRGFWYVSNGSAAPVIEISRPLANSTSHGRIYWARDFSAPDGVAYECARFASMVDGIWNWIRRNAHRRLSNGKRDGPYYLSEAWSRLRR